MESTGNLFNFKEKRNIPKLLKDIGLGASLYLLTLKAFMWLFLGLTILNFPILALYGSGKENVNRASPLHTCGGRVHALNQRKNLRMKKRKGSATW